MEYWRGIMDWPIEKDWKCETCNRNVGLGWGLIHAQCRCNGCHTQYYMRDGDEKRTVLTRPLCMLKDEYREPMKRAYEKYQVFINELTDDQIDEFMPSPSNTL